MTDTPPPPPSTGGGPFPPDTPPKAPILILLANLVAGTGYFLIGQNRKGIVAVALWLIVLIPTCGSGSGLLSILYAVDGFFQAQQLERGARIGPWTFFTQRG